MSLVDQDHYAVYYADKLWNLLPAVYRTVDADSVDGRGPLREMVNRIGAQAAILRRGIDRMWEDQSIETCDDWVIAYIADLLATNLVPSLDARGQRLDVAKTIYYRRRKGTVAILEEIAHDVTGWDARVVEFFRRLGRTRHGFDPEIGLPAETDDPAGNRVLQLAEGLVGTHTGSPIGGWADLRNVFGAARAQSAFDEFAHLADFRRGRGKVGWHDIPRLGVFLWRLRSFGVDQTTPVPVLNCPAGHYVFDPTGRETPASPEGGEIGLFARGTRAYGDQWVSPAEWQLPTPIAKPLLDFLDRSGRLSLLYGDSPEASLGVFRKPGSDYVLVDPGEVTLYPELGRFTVLNPPPNDAVFVTYHYGFSSTIGAGPYDRRVLRQPPLPRPAPSSTVVGGGNALAGPLAAVAPRGTITIGDSLTYTAINPVGGGAALVEQVTIRAENKKRPVIRLPVPAPDPTEWVLTGDDGATLVLDGLLVSGGDVVLRGKFDRVTLSCCTLDPGDFDTTSAAFVTAVDGRALIPCHLQVEAQVRELIVDRCILGPVLTRAGGEIEQLTVTDSIVQGVGADQAIDLSTGLVALTRSTVLGPAQVHRLEASECILDDRVIVDDTQHGCVRFSAWATGSVLPRQYESVEVAPRSPLFTARQFGRPGYAQFLPTVDGAILSGAPGATIAAGAQDGSEMGAFAREKNPIKERGLLIKYEEFMPVGLVPVIVYVT